MQTLLQNLRFSLRMLTRTPSITATILFTLALGIGANTAIFTLDYATFLAPLPYPNADQLVMVWSRTPNFPQHTISIPDFLDWKSQNTSFQDLNAFIGARFNLATGDIPEYVSGTLTTPGFYRMEGNQFYLGRDFLPEEGQEGKNHVVILTHKLWQRLGANKHILGTRITLDNHPYTVVGVFAAGWADRGDGQLSAPLTTPQSGPSIRNARQFFVMGRLKPGVTLQQAQADMQSVTARLAQANPTTNLGWSSFVEPERNTFVSGDTKLTLRLLLGAAAFVLLIACVNVANLLLARSMKRQKEMAIRSALGASSGNIFAQLIVESLLLAVAGGALGVCVGYAALKGLLAAMPEGTLSLESEVRLSIPVLLLTLAATTLAGLLFGCAPAWLASRTDPAEALKDGGSTGASRGTQWLRRALVIAEFALALSLLSGAGLAIHSFVNLVRLDLGIQTRHVLTFLLPPSESSSKEPARIVSYYRQIIDSIQSLPSVTQTALTTSMPLEGDHYRVPITVIGKPNENAPRQHLNTGLGMVTPNFFPVFSVQLLHGRTFNSQDTASSVKVAVVNESFVHVFLNGMDSLQQRVSFRLPGPVHPASSAEIEWQIVGVFHNIALPGAIGEIPELLIPFSQAPTSNVIVAVRSLGDPAAMTRSIAAAVHSVDPQAAIAEPLTMDQFHDEILSDDRFHAILFSCFAIVALLLASLGIYGVMTFSVTQRTREIALRMALGAGRPRVLALVLREGLTLAAAGLSIGLIGAFFIARAMQSMLFGVATMDYIAIGAVAALLLAASLFACYFPGRRAASVDPMQVLRSE